MALFHSQARRHMINAVTWYPLQVVAKHLATDKLKKVNEKAKLA